ncbi:hypothetical protein BJ138DRAFT_1010673, partial [Hygrophoropsis aurantiaca]
MSAQLLSYVNRTYSTTAVSSTDSVEDNLNGKSDGPPERSALRLSIDAHGELVESNQIHDYVYRSLSLKHLNFYQFARCVELKRNSKKQCDPGYDLETPSANAYQRHCLLAPHPLVNSHHLIEHTNEDRGEDNRHLVPRVVGQSIPSPRNTEEYFPFVLAHFKPFSVSEDLLCANDTFESLFQAYDFDQQSLSVMRNWDAIHECEDARD